MPDRQRIALIACIAVLHVVADLLFFNLKTIQGHLYVIFTEVILQLAINTIAAPNGDGKSANSPRKELAVVLLLNAITVVYKTLFISFLDGATYRSDFTEIFSFASGPAYGLASVADGYVDVIANALHQCGLCVRGPQIPLNEPFIAYLFTGISKVAGEFNQHVLWLTLHVVNFLTAVILLKTTREIYPSIRFPWILPVLYLLLSDVHGANLLLFKDGLVMFLLVSIFYLNARYILQGSLGRLPFELLSILLIVLIYQLRSGTLAVIACLSILSCMFDRKNWLQHIRIFLIGVAIVGILGNGDGIADKLEKSVKRVIDKILVGSGSHLDMENLSYTTSQTNSLLTKLELNKITVSNFFYAPLVKGSLYFLLPLPVNKSVSTADFLHKFNTLVYWALFLLFLIGIYKILVHKTREEWYLLAIFGVCMAMMLGAGPMLYPRYRIMASGFFLLIAALGASRVSNGVIGKSVGGSVVVLATVVLWYDDIYGLIQSVT